MTSQALLSSRTNVSERATRNEELRKEAGATNEALRKEVVKLLVDSQDENKKAIWIHRDSKGTHDFDFLGMISNGLISKEGSVMEVVIITSAIDGITGGLLLVQSKDDKLAKEVKDQITAAIDALNQEGEAGKRVRGGGAKGRYMCKVEGKFGKREKEAVEGIVEGLMGKP